MRTNDYSGRDLPEHVSFLGQIQTRRGFPRQTCLDYFRDVHGITGARVPSFYRYWQHHYGPAAGGVFPPLDGVEQACGAEDQIDAVAHIVHRSQDERPMPEQRAADWVTQFIADDEKNPFQSNYVYFTMPGQRVTVVDGFESPVPNGAPTGPFFHLWIRGRDGVSHDEVHRFLRDGIAPAWTADANVKFMRLHLSEPFNADAWPTKGVTHDRTPEQMYDACVELAFDTPAEMRAFFASDAYRSTEAGLGRTLAAMHAFPVVATYSYLYDYRPTPVATRGWPVVSLIEALSATNQYEDRVTDLVAPPFQVTAAEQRSMAEQRLAAE